MVGAFTNTRIFGDIEMTNSNKLGSRIGYFRINEIDRANIKQIQKIIEPHMRQIVDEFYKHIGKFPEAVAIVSRAGTTIDRLKQTNSLFFTEFFKAEFGVAYFDSRVKIGKIHAHVGLTPEWFFGAMSTYYEMMIPLIIKACKFNGAKAASMVSSFVKALNLDQEIIMEAYIEFGFIEQIRSANEKIDNVVANLAGNASLLRRSAEENQEAQKQIADVCDSLAESSVTQTALSAQLRDSAMSLTTSSEEMTSRSETQTTSVHMANDAICEVSGNIDSIAELAGLWETMRERAKSISELETIAEGASKRVKEMDQRSDEIGRIVNTINDIAAQTNMLALNATIEAARAGEHGRGFAVVAEEVRGLAAGTASATKEISDLIQAVQKNSKLAAEAMEHTIQNVKSAIEVTTEASGCLESISQASLKTASASNRMTEAFQNVSYAAESIATALTAVDQEISTINKAVDKISLSTESNMAANEELSATTQENSIRSQEYASSMAEMDEQVQVLREVAEKAHQTLAKSQTSVGSHLRLAA